MPAVPLSQVAVQLRPEDNVAVAARPLGPGTDVRVNGRAVTEASGGVTIETVRQIAETGVNWISIGALTHSAPALNLGLDFD